MGEGTVFSLFVSPHLDGGGYPSQVWMVGRGYPSQVWMGGYPGQVLMVRGTPARSGWWGVPQPGLDSGRDGGGVPLNQVWMVGGTWGTPQPGLDGGGVPWVPPTMTGWGTPYHEWIWYPPTMSGWGTPPTIVSTGYAAGGMPLAFTQEDFLFVY